MRIHPLLSEHIGCYRDSIFRAMHYKGSVSSVEECLDICRKNGEKTAGLEVRDYYETM